MHQHPLHPAVHFGTALSSKLDPLAGLQKLPDLRVAQTLGIPHSDLHSPADRLPNTSHFQDHLVLESISVSGSSCIGQFSRPHTGRNLLRLRWPFIGSPRPPSIC